MYPETFQLRIFLYSVSCYLVRGTQSSICLKANIVDCSAKILFFLSVTLPKIQGKISYMESRVSNLLPWAYGED